MDVQFRLATADEVRSRIARLMLDESRPPSRIGSVTLQPHQISAVARLRTALENLNGALLCDDVGMGKTYVALAVAAEFSNCAIVAPAALVTMWRHSLAETGLDASLFTFESLSRVKAVRDSGGGVSIRARFDIVIVDEAHHARNMATNRYFALSSLVRGARVVLLSATPIHNRRKDLVSLLSLFLGGRAARMTAAELALCVVRREHAQLAGVARIPRVMTPIHHHVSDEPHLVERLMNLPPPIATRDGGLGGALIGRSLVHQWASSEAALREALKRRVARASALCASLECGRLPSAGDLATWIYGDGALQLGFAELLAEPVPSHRELLSVVRRHLAGLEDIRASFDAATTIDGERAAIVSAIRADNPGVGIVAFAQYSETVSTLFRRLVASGRVALLTSHGARVAGGPLSRDEAIQRFAPIANHSVAPRPSESVDLLLTTDLLSEGVNLQDAAVVVHLDVPWTPARMEQRVGRVARLGSAHERTTVHVLAPPASAEKVLGAEMVIERKWGIAGAAVGTRSRSPLSTDAASSDSLPARTERLRSMLASWTTVEAAASDDCPVATAEATCSGFVAVVSMGANLLLVVGEGDGIAADLNDQLRVCARAGGADGETTVERRQHAIVEIRKWGERELASRAAGMGESTLVRRRRLTARIDEAIQSALPHQRTRRSALAARARRVVTAQQCAAVETELEVLLHSPASTDDWLEAVAGLESPAREIDTPANAGTPCIHALLLLGGSA
jgi:superfamily II DNA or RNA helicase